MTLPPQQTFAVFDGPGSPEDLSRLCVGLLAEQARTWPELSEAYPALRHVRKRVIACDGFSVRLEHNPARMINSTAPVGQGLGGRPCFLCPSALPEAQKGILYRNEYVILCNPRPVLPLHLTVSSMEHEPQAILGNGAAFVRLCADLGRGWAVLYNGPRCGASAPDHLHFQAVPSGHTPIEEEIRQDGRLALLFRREGIDVFHAIGFGREVILIEGRDPEAVAAALEECVVGLRQVPGGEEEPMVNIAGLYGNGLWRIIVFPRREHRPAVFFAEGDARIVVSPAVLEMCGLIVTPVERDFERLDARAVEAIYNEVSLRASP